MRKSILSKRKYAAALKTLSKTRDFTKISVTDICAGCGLSRKGFYYHFADKFSLVAWILQHEFIDQIPPQSEADAWQVFGLLCSYLYRENEFYRKCFESAVGPALRGYLAQSIAAYARKLSESAFPDQETAEFFAVYCGDAIAAMICKWIADEKIMRPAAFLKNTRSVLINLCGRFRPETDSSDSESPDKDGTLSVRPYQALR